ncbi:MAG: MFS transporter [Ktedonobacterales bacterium]
MSILPVETSSTTAQQTQSRPPMQPPANKATQRRWTIAFACYTLAINTSFTRAVWIVYLAAHGYSPFAIGLVEMIFHIAKFVAEMPTGVFADLVGRRASLIVSCVLAAIGELLFVVPSFPVIVLSFALLGVAYAFRGGADSAMLWALAERVGVSDKATHYSKLYSRMFLLLLLGETLGAASGGFIGGIWALLPFICQGIVAVLAIPPLFFLPEVRLAHSERHSPLRHIGAGLRAAWRDPVLLGLLLLSGLTASVFTTLGYYTQLYFHDLGFSLSAIGIIFALAIVPDSLFASLAPRIIHRLPQPWLITIFVASEALGLASMSAQQPLLGIVGFLLLFHSADAVLTPAISRYLNERSPEAQRATVLSLDTGLFSAAMIVLFPLFGLGLTQASYHAIFLWTLAALLAGSLTIAILVWLLRRRRVH